MRYWFRSDRRFVWTLLALLAAAGWSTSGLIIRLVEDATIMQSLFYRNMCLISAVTAFVYFRYRLNTFRAFRSVGWLGLIAGASLGAASVMFFVALELTTVANISFIIASAPFIVGALAWLIMREPMKRLTIVTAIIALCGIAIMVGEGFVSRQWAGNLAAIACVSFISIHVVAVRLGRGRDMIPTVALAGVFGAVFALGLIDGFAITLRDFLLCAAQGIFVSAICNGVFIICARHLPAAEITVFSMIESVLAPVWVFLALAEIPSSYTILGGFIILSAIALQAFWPRRN